MYLKKRRNTSTLMANDLEKVMRRKTSNGSKAQVHPAGNDSGALDDLWRAKYHFNRTKLGVAEDKARDAADRTIASVQQARLELQTT
jgi:cytochrome c556